MKVPNNFVQVWDPIVRFGHWTLAVAFFTAYLTEDDLLTQHVWAGYVVGVVVCVRLLWGFIGPKHARFADFVRPPAETLRYIGDLAARRAKRHIGHNPAGGAMVVAVLVLGPALGLTTVDAAGVGEAVVAGCAAGVAQPPRPSAATSSTAGQWPRAGIQRGVRMAALSRVWG